LALSHPDSRVGRHSDGVDSECFQPLNQRLFDSPQEQMEVAPVPAKIEDGVSHELARSVVGDVATAIYFKKRYTALTELLRRAEQMLRIGGASEGDSRRVLQHEQCVVYAFLMTELHHLALKLPGGAVLYSSKPDRPQGTL